MDFGLCQPQPFVLDLQGFQPFLLELEPEEMIAVVKARTEERKAKTEEKRRETVKCLEERRVRNEEESKFKLFGLPDSVWEKEILTLVKDPKDLGSMWKVHPKFRQLSGESQSRECLLSQALNIEKLPHMWGDENERISKLKMFRTFSKGMRTSGDRCFDEDFMTRLRSLGGRQKGLSLTFDDDWEEDEVLEKLVGDFCVGPEETRAKRVLHRTIEVTYMPSWMWRPGQVRFPFRREMTSVLERIGDQIWHFIFVLSDSNKEFNRSGMSLNEVYIFLHEWISLMPNLKRLTFAFFVDLHSKKAELSRETLESYPFLHLTQLERVQFGAFPNVQTKTTLAAAVIRPNLQIKALDFVGFGTKKEDRLFLTEMKPLLSMLKLNMFGGNQDWTQPTIDILQPLYCKEWSLRCFSANIKGSLGIFFKFLNKIETLEQVALRVDDFDVGDGKIPSISLSNLVLFKMDISIRSVNFSNVDDVVFFTSLQFIFRCEKLKTLEWSFSGFKLDSNSKKEFRDFLFQHDKSEMIKFKCGFQDLELSNVWNVFPELEHVKTWIWKYDKREEKSGEFRKSKLL